MPDTHWTDVGSVEDLKKKPLQEVSSGKTTIALTYKGGSFAAISGVCNHVGGPLGEGTLDGDYVVCPWHYWKFHRKTGEGEVGISTTAMTLDHPRYSGSDALLEVALGHARSGLQLETQYIKLRELNFRSCEGFYSKSAQACTWPCSITQMDPTDQLDRVYEAIVHWADVILVATPIRWGNASSLYYKMVERMNCIQNQETIANKHLLKNKVAAFIIMGGQDNVQGVAGQLMTFFAEVGCQFPQFPFIAHSRGWSAEDMERNVSEVQNSRELREGAQALVARAADMARLMVAGQLPEHALARGGRKAHQLDSEPTG
jgi:nitrite reductase/ring-hydroxylating ferredoxin subunit/multimeric flavodoxin WrbA